jgi:hypothetical protein
MNEELIKDKLEQRGARVDDKIVRIKVFYKV